MLEVGTKAPDIEAIDQQGRPFRLAELHGTWVVLFFYPKDGMPACTAQAYAFRDGLDAFAGLGAEIVGVSTQGPDSHLRFSERHGLPFRLLADQEKDIARSYEAAGLLGVPRRITYLVDPEGVIRGAYRSELHPTSHVEWARTQLRDLVSGAARNP